MNKYYRDTWAEVNLDHIEANVRSLKRHLPEETAIIAVVKANAYGHGDVEVANAALRAGASRLAVAFLDEALALREKGVTVPILVMGAARPSDIGIAAKHHIALTAYSIDWLKQAGSYDTKESVPIHIKLDTGMGRLGVKQRDELEEVLTFIEKHPSFCLEGVFTHFATADEKDKTYFDKQYERFLELIEHVNQKNVIIHCANSATSLRFPKKVFNAVRFGISMYGLAPSADIVDEIPFALKEAFSLHSSIVHIKKMKKGEKISYGATYTANEDEWIGTVPIGYADGWIRRLSGFEVLVEGERVPIVGRICMDQLMIKLHKKQPLGTKVTLIGTQNGQTISVDEVAKRLDTINYEVPCMIGWRVPRIFLKNGRIMEVRNSLL
ncbi:alanine racemase [Bacillus sp. FJAT-47783]|uniref:alanine racemase n=1 Tax=Bacillus sp. FJAT-47783 TaxID=2922712 RepID=UPI001FACF547|nr:alanine racemase [Bacillus sp. FJAT-47783]